MSILMGSQAAVNEREMRGYRWLWPGMLGAALSVTPLQGTRAITTQEQPRHPSPFFNVQKTNPPGLSLGLNVLLQDGSLQEQPIQPGPVLRTGISSKPVPATRTVVITTIEQPGHPPSFFGGRGIQLNVISPEIRALVIRQEQPTHPFPALRAGVQGPDVASNIKSVITRQEAPRDGFVVFAAGIQGPNVAIGIRSIATTQETPSHPYPLLRAGAQGPNVGPPVTASTGLVVGRQQQPEHPSPFLWSRQGAQAASASTPERRAVSVSAEQPSHPSSYLWRGAQPSAAQANNALLAAILQDGSLQEQPVQPASQVRAGTASAVTIRAFGGALVTTREQPGHPHPISRAGVQGPNAGGPETRAVLVRQEQPFHPGSWFDKGATGLDILSSSGGSSFVKGTHSDALQRDLRGQAWLWQGQTFAAAAPVVPVVTTVIQDGSLQEQPARPPSVLVSFIAVSAVQLSPVRRAVITTQEAPFHSLPYVWRAQVYTPAVSVAPVRRDVVTVQEQPAHPSPYLWRAQVFTPSIFSAPERRHVVTAQELPSHPGPITRAGIQGPNVASGITSSVIVPPQVPANPLPIVRAGVQGPNVGAPERRAAIVAQEQPWHPASRVYPSLPPIFSAPALQSATTIGRQQLPDHPPSFLWAGRHPLLLVHTPGRRWLITTQEQPWHPTGEIGTSINYIRGFPITSTPRLIGTEIAINLKGEIDR